MELPVILRNVCGGSKLIGKQQTDSCDLFLFY